jgi:hypothetical protein
MKRLALLVSALCAATACSDTPEINLGGNYAVAVTMPPTENHAIDVLFVVDDSGSMGDQQADLAARAQEALFDVIDSAVGGQPDLHVGVVSTNMGAGGFNIPGCADQGDDGHLLVQTAADGTSCGGLTDHYIVDEAAPGGGRHTNYTGTLADVFACQVKVGVLGCGFEQPLASLERAISGEVGANAGFLRPDALLVVIVITDEDDCSAKAALFDPDAEATLGRLSSFRCFQHAMVCDEPDLSTPGPKTNCHPDDSAPLVNPLQQTVDALVAAKGGDPSKVMIAAIAAPTEPVQVVAQDNGAGGTQAVELGASCTDANLDLASPAIRLEKLLHSFPGHAWFESICGDVAPALRHTANLVGDVAARRPCLRGSFKDSDAAKPGVQPSCRAFAAAKPFSPDEPRTELRACKGEGDTSPCFRISDDAAACGDDSALGLRADAFNVELEGRSLVVECLTP